jgi:transcriptional regulator GlxA family with amidase domain
MLRVQVLALEGVFDVGLAALLDGLAVANDLAPAAGLPAPRFDVRVVGVRRNVTTGQGFKVPLEAAEDLPCPDVLVAPALSAKTPDTLRETLRRRDVVDAADLLRRRAESGAFVAAACTGTFVLASASLLDGEAATTTWWLAPLFRELFPKVALDESKMLVSGRRVATAGAALAHVDLALWLIRRSSPSLASLTAHYLVSDPRPSQAAYAIPDHLAHFDPMVERFERWARKRIAEGFSLSAAARAVGASERTLARKLHSVLGKSPLGYFQDLRVEKAVHLLQTTDASIEEIASQVGYANGMTLRTLLRRRIGLGVREIRARA